MSLFPSLKIGKIIRSDFLVIVLIIIFFIVLPVAADNTCELTDLPDSGAHYYHNTVLPNIVCDASMCQGCNNVANAPAWNLMHYSGGTWSSVTGYVTTAFSITTDQGPIVPMCACGQCTGTCNVAVFRPQWSGYKTFASGDEPVNVSASFYADVTTGDPPLTVTFTDTSTGTPAVDSWSWNFTVSPGSTDQNPVKVFSDPGDYDVSLTAGNGDTSDTETKLSYIHVNEWQPPVASFTCSPLSGDSPLTVSCTDTSSNNPALHHWIFTGPSSMVISPDGETYGDYTRGHNYTSNPQYTFTGSGDVDVQLYVANPAGDDLLLKSKYIVVNGPAPTPTPTPVVPWPNQTGVCWKSGISLGSQTTPAFDVHYQLTDPQGDTYSGNYPSGSMNVISNQPFFTALLGTYTYQELKILDGTLLWRQSYIVQDCTVTPTVTETSLTQFPTPTTIYTIPATYPVTSIPTYRYTIPPTGGPTYPTITQSPLFPTYATIAPVYSGSELYNFTITVSPVSKPIVDWIKSWLDNVIFGATDSVLGLVLSPISFITGNTALAITQTMALLIGFSAFPFLFVYGVITIIRNMPDKVVMFFALLLWINIIFYSYDRFKRGGR